MIFPIFSVARHAMRCLAAETRSSIKHPSPKSAATGFCMLPNVTWAEETCAPMTASDVGVACWTRGWTGVGPPPWAVERHHLRHAGDIQVQRGGREPQLERLERHQRRCRVWTHGWLRAGRWSDRAPVVIFCSVCVLNCCAVC